MANKPDILFWHHNHPKSKLYDKLYNKYVPTFGPTDYVEAEMLRAIRTIYYDWYNNGFGNDWSGAWRYLKNHSGELPPEALECLYVLQPYMYGYQPLEDDSIEATEVSLEELTEMVIDHANSADESNAMHPLDVDMHSLSEDKEPEGDYDDDYGDEEYYEYEDDEYEDDEYEDDDGDGEEDE